MPSQHVGTQPCHMLLACIVSGESYVNVFRREHLVVSLAYVFGYQ